MGKLKEKIGALIDEKTEDIADVRNDSLFSWATERRIDADVLAEELRRTRALRDEFQTEWTPALEKFHRELERLGSAQSDLAEKNTIEPVQRRWRERGLFGDPRGVIRYGSDSYEVATARGPEKVAGALTPERQMPDFDRRIRILEDLLGRACAEAGEPEGLTALRVELETARLELLDREDERRRLATKAAVAPRKYGADHRKAVQARDQARDEVNALEKTIRDDWGADPRFTLGPKGGDAA